MNLSARPRQRVHSYPLGEGQQDDQRVLQVLRDGVSKSDWREKANRGRLPREHISCWEYTYYMQDIFTQSNSLKNDSS